MKRRFQSTKQSEPRSGVPGASAPSGPVSTVGGAGGIEGPAVGASDEQQAPWWRSFFDLTYARAELVPSDPGPSEHAADCLVRWLNVAPGDLVMDQCCGVGRVALPLAARGVRLIGVDQSDAYVRLAREEAVRRRLDATFHVGDAMDWIAPEPCDAAFNWFTSFGYQVDDRENVRMLFSAWSSLRPGGRFALDYLNVPSLFRRFRSSTVHRPSGVGAAGLIILDEPTIDFRAGMVESTWTFLHADGRRDERTVRTRLLMPHELVRLFETAGFRVIDVLDGETGEPLSLGSRRVVILGERPSH